MAGFMDSLGTGVGGAIGDALGSLIPTTTTTTTNGTQKGSGTSTSQKVLSQAAIDKLVYDVLSADNGLAALATGENLGGGYAASTKALLAQDFVTKLVGELATVTAPTVTTQAAEQKTTSTATAKKKLSVICTELNRQGLLSDELYNHPAATAHFLSLHPYTLLGYHAWAIPLVARMQKSPALSMALFPAAHGRYVQITTGKRTLGGFLTIHIGQPLCFLIGATVVALQSIKGKKEDKNGYVH